MSGEFLVDACSAGSSADDEYREGLVKARPLIGALNAGSCLSNGPSGRLRLTARPASGPLQVTIEVIPAAAAADLVPGPEEHLLITDPGGEILETDRARPKACKFIRDRILTACGSDIIRNFVHAVRRRQSQEAGDAWPRADRYGKLCTGPY